MVVAFVVVSLIVLAVGIDYYVSGCITPPLAARECGSENIGQELWVLLLVLVVTGLVFYFKYRNLDKE